MVNNNVLTQFQDTVMQLSKELMNFSGELMEKQRKQGRNPSFVNTVYILLREIDRAKKPSKDIGVIKELFESVPVLFHVQIMRMFLDRYYEELLIDKEINPASNRTQRIVRILQDTESEFLKKLNRIPSPFEVIYLTIDYYLDANQNGGQATRLNEELDLFLRDPKSMRRALIDYLTYYNSTFGEELKRGVISNEDD